MNCMEKDWNCIYSTNEAYMAEIAKNKLADNGIEAVVINKQDSLYLFGSVELYVKNDQTIKAKHLLKNISS